MKRVLDFVFASVGLVLFGWLIFLFALIVWVQDFHNPLFIAKRIGQFGNVFKMIKLRSMVVDAESTGVSSTAGDDPRITTIGKLIRRFKIDELPQLINVLRGEMSLVGPRPNVESEVRLYTDYERGLLRVRPGITDFSSIVFSDEADILYGQSAPDLAYNELIRPWKSRLGIFYIEHQNIYLDLVLVFLTVCNSINREWTLGKLAQLLNAQGANRHLIKVSLRRSPLSQMKKLPN